MRIKWLLEFDVKLPKAPSFLDKRQYRNAVLEVEALGYSNGVLELVTCDVIHTPSSKGHEVYRASDDTPGFSAVIPDRKELDQVLPNVTAFAKAEALVRSAEIAGVPNPVVAVRAMLSVQEEFMPRVNELYEALDAIAEVKKAALR
jgi:hypothetical protein